MTKGTISYDPKLGGLDLPTFTAYVKKNYPTDLKDAELIHKRLISEKKAKETKLEAGKKKAKAILSGEVKK